MALPYMFSPVRLGKVEIMNRTVMAPMGVGLFSPTEMWPVQHIRYYEERAVGGIGLIITSFVRVHESLSSIPLNAIYHDRFIPAHKSLVDCIHRYETKIFCQLGLMGGKLSSDAPSAIYSPTYWTKPRELTTEELDECVDAFITAAPRAIASGYDGIELHGGHSYLLGELQSPATNKRTDKYGGSFENRMRFITDVINGIKKNHPDLPIGYKFSVHEEFPDGVKIDLAKEIAWYINKLGVVYLHVCTSSTGVNIPSKYASFPPLYMPRNTLMPLVREIKHAVPEAVVLAGGSITVPEEAEEFIKTGDCDMVVLGRTILADPHWPNKAKAGKRAVPCIRCNACWQKLMETGPIHCTVNPYLLREAQQDLPIPAKKKKVMIVGAGPAGMRCALTAAKRGHDVTLHEKEPYIGGLLYPGSRPKCKEDVARLLEWFGDELAESTVKVKLNTKVTPELVEQEEPDALVIAIGTELDLPDIPGIDLPNTACAVDVLRDITKYSGRKAVVVGGGDVGCETACHLTDNGWEVKIVEMLPKLMEKEHIISNKIQMLMMIEENENITVMTETKLNAIIEEGAEVILPSGKQWGLEADLVVIACGMKYSSTLEGRNIENMSYIWNGPGGEIGLRAKEVHYIGDCRNLGRIREAIEDGEKIGRWL